MTKRRTPLPSALGAEFSVDAAIASGVTRSRLRGTDLTQPFWGTRMAVFEGVGTLAESLEMRRMRAYATRMPEEAFYSHTSAAEAWGISLPRGAADLLHVSVLAPGRPPEGRGIRGHQLNPAMVSVRTRHGLRVASPASTWAQLGSMLDLRDLVAAGDALLHRPRTPDGQHLPPLATHEELVAALVAGRRNGADKLRTALGLVRVGAASRPESHLRLALADAGLPDPVLDFDVYARNGSRIGWTEIAYPQWRVLVEYEGEHHRLDAKQWNRDILKHDLCREAGWNVVRITAEHLYPRSDVAVERVRTALHDAGWRPGA